jgi:hypothetical protein
MKEISIEIEVPSFALQIAEAPNKKTQNGIMCCLDKVLTQCHFTHYGFHRKPSGIEPDAQQW